MRVHVCLRLLGHTHTQTHANWVTLNEFHFRSLLLLFLCANCVALFTQLIIELYCGMCLHTYTHLYVLYIYVHVNVFILFIHTRVFPYLLNCHKTETSSNIFQYIKKHQGRRQICVSAQLSKVTAAVVQHCCVCCDEGYSNFTICANLQKHFWFVLAVASTSSITDRPPAVAPKIAQLQLSMFVCLCVCVCRCMGEQVHLILDA